MCESSKGQAGTSFELTVEMIEAGGAALLESGYGNDFLEVTPAKAAEAVARAILPLAFAVRPKLQGGS